MFGAAEEPAGGVRRQVGKYAQAGEKKRANFFLKKVCLITSVVSSFTVFANSYSEFVNGRYFSHFANANAFQKPHVFSLAAFPPPHTHTELVAC